MLNADEAVVSAALGRPSLSDRVAGTGRKRTGSFREPKRSERTFLRSDQAAGMRHPSRSFYRGWHT